MDSQQSQYSRKTLWKAFLTGHKRLSSSLEQDYTVYTSSPLQRVDRRDYILAVLKEKKTGKNEGNGKKRREKGRKEGNSRKKEGKYTFFTYI